MAADILTTWLLWVVAVVGVWNLLNMVARIYYKAPWWPYAWHVITGFAATTILFIRK